MKGQIPLKICNGTMETHMFCVQSPWKAYLTEMEWLSDMYKIL